MSDKLFISALNMSLIGSYVIVFVLIARLLLKKMPKIFSYTLWAIVLFRLLCPFSFESALSLIPVTKTPIPQDIIYSTTPQINTGIAVFDSVVNPILPVPSNIGASMNPIQIWLFIGAVIWTFGMVTMVIYSVVAFIKLKQSLISAAPFKDNIYLADHISSPFVMELFKPKIYLPSSISDSEKVFVIAHEMCHIRRFDHVTRILAFATLTIHWFNPLVWIAFIVSGKDMEMSCDEAVMKKMDTDIRAEYSQSLLGFGSTKRMIHATPITFGQGDTKSRVKNVLSYKKPKFWVILAMALASVIAMFCLGSNPKSMTPPPLYAYSENGVVPMNLGTYSWNGVVADSVPYAEMVYENAISYNENKGHKNTNIFFSTSDIPSDFNSDNAKSTKNFEVVEMKRYLSGKEIVLDDFVDNMIMVSLEQNASYLYVFKVQFGEDYAYYSIKINNNVEESESLSKPLSHDQATASALFSLANKFPMGECISEGHIILGYDDSNKNETKIYALTAMSKYGFENGNFVEVSGSAFPAVITLFSDNKVEIEEPLDGSDYAKSVEKMFPKEYHDKIFKYDDTDGYALKQQKEKYAREYLAQIGREAKIGDYSDFDYTSLTDVDISAETSNNLQVFYKEHNYYPSFIGTREQLENDVRMVYEMSYITNQDEISFTKYSYDTKQILEQFIYDVNTGNIVLHIYNSFPFYENAM